MFLTRSTCSCTWRLPFGQIVYPGRNIRNACSLVRCLGQVDFCCICWRKCGGKFGATSVFKSLISIDQNLQLSKWFQIITTSRHSWIMPHAIWSHISIYQHICSGFQSWCMKPTLERDSNSFTKWRHWDVARGFCTHQHVVFDFPFSLHFLSLIAFVSVVWNLRRICKEKRRPLFGRQNILGKHSEGTGWLDHRSRYSPRTPKDNRCCIAPSS